MFPDPRDREDYSYPEDGLLQAHGVVQATEMRNPQYLDVNDEKCFLVVKNGLTTGTTVGRVNDLDSFTHVYEHYDISNRSLEVAVLAYDKTRGKFSDAGDSGSVVLDRSGRIVGILTGGSGPTDETDVTYLTPYWLVEEEIKAKFPGCFLYHINHLVCCELEIHALLSPYRQSTIILSHRRFGNLRFPEVVGIHFGCVAHRHLGGIFFRGRASSSKERLPGRCLVRRRGISFPFLDRHGGTVVESGCKGSGELFGD